jgi:hypothetical protein
MLAKPGQLPTCAGRAFEPKWNSFRATIRTGGARTAQGLDPRLRRAEQFAQLVDAAVQPLPLG